jgi:hypothetical protein
MPSQGQRYNLIHYFNGENRERDKGVKGNGKKNLDDGRRYKINDSQLNFDELFH